MLIKAASECTSLRQLRVTRIKPIYKKKWKEVVSFKIVWQIPFWSKALQVNEGIVLSFSNILLVMSLCHIWVFKGFVGGLFYLRD